MAKLPLLALAFTALVALATAHATIITTTIEDDHPFRQCRQKLQMQRLDQCQMYLQQGQSPYELNRRQPQHGQDQEQQLQRQCCQQLQNVDRQCQCEAVRQVFETARQMQGRQQGQFGSQRQLEQQLEQKAQNLPQQCRLQIRQEECQIRRGDSQEFIRIQGQRFNQCQRFIQQAQQQQESGSPRLMMVSRHSQQQSQQLQQQLRQCCNELENVQRDRQCEALEEVYRQAVQEQQGGQQQDQPRQHGGRQQDQPRQHGRQQQDQPRQQGGQQQDQPWQQPQRQQGSQQQDQPWQQPQRQQGSQQIGRAIETIRNQCELQVQQCRIPSAMF